jgi:hypothetical protein
MPKVSKFEQSIRSDDIVLNLQQRGKPGATPPPHTQIFHTSIVIEKELYPKITVNIAPHGPENVAFVFSTKKCTLTTL